MAAVSLLACIALPASAQKTAKLPAAGTVFKFSSAAPRYVTCDLEFRDPTEAKWPNFFFGKPGGDGQLVFALEGSKVDVVLNCPTMVQRNGEQERRLFGELCKEKAPAVSFAISSMGKWTSETVDSIDNKGKKVTKTVDFVPTEGTLDVGGKTVKVKGKSTLKFQFEKGSDTATSVAFDTRFTLRGGDLGLAAVPGEIQVRAGTTGYVELPTGKKK